MHIALCVCQLPEDTHIREVEGVGVAEGTVEYHIAGVQRHYWLFGDVQLQQSCNKEQGTEKYQ